MAKLTHKMIDAEKSKIISSYKENWNRMISEWSSNDPRDSFWLMFSASYLFKTNGVRWALDPVSLLNRLSKKHAVNFADDLKDLSFVLISHLHSDHFDKTIINKLSSLEIKWIIPDAIRDEVMSETRLKVKNVVTIHPQETINLHGFHIKAYEGFHNSDRIKIDSASFYIETNRLRMFFPGDARRYEKRSLPKLPSLDYFFAHLWLGYETALDDVHDLLAPFCDFSASSKSQNIILSHLFEVARDSNSYWNKTHANKAKKLFQEKYPDINIKIPFLTKRVLL